MVVYSSQFTRFGAENACFLPGLETWLGWSDPQILPCINGMLLKGMLVSIVKKKRWFKCRVPFNFNELSIQLSGDVHPQPGPVETGDREILRRNNNGDNCSSTSRYFKFALLNTRSVRNKAMIVKDFAVDNDIDALALTETWLRSDNDDNIEIGTLVPTGYRFLHVPRPLGRGGGVGLLFKDTLNINTTLTVSFNTFELMDVRLRSLQSVRVLIIYRPPESNSLNTFFEEFSRLLENTIAETSGRLLLTGVFNIHIDCPNDGNAKRFIDILDSFDLKQRVSSVTHRNGQFLLRILSFNHLNV